MTETMPAFTVCVAQLRFRYEPARPIIENCSFSVAGPGHIGIIGPNGSGKSTLFRLLIRLVKAETGQIVLNHKALDDFSQKELARSLSFVPQEFETLFPFRVWDVVMMGRAPYLGSFALERPEDCAIVEAALRFTDTLAFAHRPITELSGGERARVLFARAIAQDTPLLLLDEPANHLDLHYQWKMMDWIDALVAEKKKTVLSVLHQLDHARRASEIILWKHGRPFRQGPPAELLDKTILLSLFNENSGGPGKFSGA